MRAQMSAARFFCCLFLITVVKTVLACAEPESMARPTRPKAFATPEDLNRYLALVGEYYSGKIRYGKRNDLMVSENSVWEMLRMILDNAQRQNEQQRQERIRQDKQPFLFSDF